MTDVVEKKKIIEQKIIELDYDDLVNEKDLSDKIEKAYGKDGLGILLVNNVPNLEKVRKPALENTFKFATLDEKIKNSYVNKESFYSIGWSHGKEKFKGKFGILLLLILTF